MREHSGNLFLNGEMTAEKAIKFLDEARSYFAGRPTGGEDSAYWANVYNAEWCEKISAFIGAGGEKVRSSALEALAVSDTNNDLAAKLSTSQARLSEAVKVLEEAYEHIETLSELLKVIKESWIDYDHVFSIAVHEADKWIEEKAKPLLANE